MRIKCCKSVIRQALYFQCFYLYWATSAVYTLTQNVVLLFPKVRRAVNIPELPTESKTPIQDMVKSAKKKLTSRDSS